MSARAPIVVERVIRAKPERVFAAFADPTSLARWMCPSDDMTHASVELDFRVGGRFRIVMHGAERDYAQHGEYLAIEPGRRIQMTWISEFLPEAERRTRVTVHFEPEGDATRVRLVHDELPAGETYDGHVSGWARILSCLSDAITP
jgi:uncharacterized protein YndB with AHSA1/START domain